jgi:hypothetical protein
MSLEKEYEQFVERFLSFAVTERPALLESGKDLAIRLNSASVSLCYNKATEFSPDIERFFLYAAKVAFLTYGKGTPALEPFEKDVFYYKNFNPPSHIMAEYESFCANNVWLKE